MTLSPFFKANFQFDNCKHDTGLLMFCFKADLQEELVEVVHNSIHVSGGVEGFLYVLRNCINSYCEECMIIVEK